MINLFETHNDFCNNHGVFHRCKLNGKDYFFTEERIAPKDMPDGLYKADIRGSWGKDEWATIEPFARVDHRATIISDKEFHYDTFVNRNGTKDYYEPITECEIDWDEENR